MHHYFSLKAFLVSTITLLLSHSCFAQTAPPANFAFGIGSSGNNTQYGYACAKDAAGNTFVTGVFQGTADFNPSTTVTNSLTSTSGAVTTACDIFLAKYSSTGAYLWAIHMGSGAITNNNNYGAHLVLDNAGNVYLTGDFTGTADFNPAAAVTNNLVSKGSSDAFIAKYDANGAYQWAVSMGSTGMDVGQRLAYDNVNNYVYVAGEFNGTVDFDPTAGITSLTSAGQYDVFIGAYNASNGNMVWVKSFGGTGQDAINGMVMDADRNLYLEGYFTGAVDFDPGAGTHNLVSNGNTDIFTAKYDMNGNYKWANSIGTTNADQGMGIALDFNGSVVITGYAGGLTGTTIDLDPSPAATSLKTFAVTTSREGIIVKLDSASGAYRWGVLCSGITNHIIQPYSIAIDASNDIFITGFCTTTSIFDPSSAATSTITVGAGGANDGFVAKYNGNGTIQWVFDYGGYFTYPEYINYDATSGTFLSTGGFQTNTTLPTIDFDPTAASLKLSSNGNAINIYVASYKDNKTWIGATGAWNTAANWSPAGVPTLYDHISIPTGSPAVGGTVSASSVLFSGTGSLAVPAGAMLQIGGAVRGNNSIDATAGTLSLKGFVGQKVATGSFTSNTFGNLIIDNPEFASLTNKTTVKSALSVNNSDSLYVGDTLQLGGSVSNGIGKIDATAGTLVFNGTAAQGFFDGTFLKNTVKNIVINNAAGLTIGSTDTITNALTLTAGKINTGTHKLVLVSGATATGGSSSSFVNGYLCKLGAQDFTFPVGSGSKYAPISISGSNDASNIFTASYYPTNPQVAYPTATYVALAGISKVEYWILTREAGNNVDVTLSWEQSRSGNISNLADLGVGSLFSNAWHNQGNTVTTGNTTAGTVKSYGGLAYYGAFTLASAAGLNPLPLQLQFSATKGAANSVNLNWQTTHEVNTSHFNIQRSTNGIAFLTLGKEDAKGDNAYQFIDLLNPDDLRQPKLYYRLQMFDKDGTSTYSRVVAIDQKNGISVSVYPNPVKDVVYISGAASSAQVFDLSGKLLVQKQFTGSDNFIPITSLAKGVYVIKITDIRGNVTSERLVKE